MSEKPLLIVFPSVFSLNKTTFLEQSISSLLKIKKYDFTKMRRSGMLIVIETDDPVLVSAAISTLFGIEKIAIAREVGSSFETALAEITRTSMNLLLNGDKFHVKVDGRAPGYLAKDLEVAATGALIEKAADLGARAGSETIHSKLLYTYITDQHAYVCVFVDKGLGGIPYNSQKEAILCCIYDEISAMSCLQTIKMGFDVKMAVFYSSDKDLLKISKMINRIILSIPQEKITIHFSKTPKIQDQSTIVLSTTHLGAAIARSKKIARISLPILPYVLPAGFVEENVEVLLKKGLMPWLPLSGMDHGIMESSRQLGLEKYITNLEGISKTKFTIKKVPKKRIQNYVSAAMKNLESVSLTVGPKNVYDMIDALRTNH